MNALSGRSNTPGADPISQFLQIKKQCQKDNLKAEDSLEIIADDKRAYFPTQTVQARVRVNDALMSDGCQIKAEFRGEVHSYAIVSNGQTTYVDSAKTYLFSYDCILGPSGSSNAEISASPVSKTTESNFREWDLSSKLPENGSFQKKGQDLSIPLPTTFRDHRRSKQSGINWISYGWKVTAEIKGITKKNKRFWFPILVLPLSYKQPPDAGIGRSLEPPGYGSLKEGDRKLPQGWTSEKAVSKIKKGLLFSKGMIELKLSVPPSSSLSLTSPLPFLLQVQVFASDVSDLDPNSSSSILPELPLSGAGEQHCKFELRRKDVSRGATMKSKVSDGARFSTHHSMPIQVEWSNGHLGGKGEGEIRGVDKGDRFQLSEIQGLASPWSKPSKGASSKAEVVEDPQEKKLSRKVSLDSMDSGSSSTIETDEKKSFFSKLGFSKGKGKEKAEEEEISDSSFPFSTTATISGLLPTFVTPPIHLRKLTTSYTLRIRWNLKGMGNTLKETFHDFDLENLDSGVTLREVEEFKNDPEGLSSKTLGWREKALKDGLTVGDQEEEDDDEELGSQVESQVQGDVPPYSSK